MIEDLPLFAVTHSRKGGPQTSYDAAGSMATAAALQERYLYDALMAWGPLTADEADQWLGWRPTTAGRRMSDLVRKGLARSTGQTRPTRSGRQADVYEAIKQSETA